jgi:HAD superfamily hydrolase (TIGR01509 family)
MDGLLLDTETVSRRCWKGAEEETGFYMPEGFYFTLIGQSMRCIRVKLIEAMDPACDVDEFLKVASRIYTDALTNEPVPVKAGATELLQYLEINQIPRCLATSTGRDLCRHKLESSGLLKYLPLRVCGNDVTRSKPSPDIYLKAAELVGFPPQELLAVEDSQNGLISAKEAGCRTTHIPDLGPVDLSIQARADRIYRDLHEFRSALERDEIVILR